MQCQIHFFLIGQPGAKPFPDKAVYAANAGKFRGTGLCNLAVQKLRSIFRKLLPRNEPLCKQADMGKISGISNAVLVIDQLVIIFHHIQHIRCQLLNPPVFLIIRMLLNMISLPCSSRARTSELFRTLTALMLLSPLSVLIYRYMPVSVIVFPHLCESHSDTSKNYPFGYASGLSGPYLPGLHI